MNLLHRIQGISKTLVTYTAYGILSRQSKRLLHPGIKPTGWKGGHTLPAINSVPAAFNGKDR